ncbi:hypothetical protein CKO28_15920 [Rhodovibrio sodomensis]|uniref:Helix-turn-helix domain-containing protein n=1 Tax=Rhodovibrio sodomensis TaxID=1088 RepID=A0ABS1DHE7_9PROT|nr:hypothetical protein [Rhodovibrio sodomensis]
MNEPEFLTTEEVAERLRHSSRHVRYLIQSERLKAVRCTEGGRWLIPYSSYKQYVAELLV